MTTKINHEFKIGEPVYLVSDGDQVKRQVVNIVLTPNGILYSIRVDGELIDVSEIELSAKRDVM